MLAFRNTADAINEPKSARMEQRTKPRIKAEIQRAAALLGVDETTFVVSVAYERALQTIEGHERTLLAAVDRDAFLEALAKPAEPTEELRAAVAMHKRKVRKGA